MIGKRGTSRQRIMETRGRPFRRLEFDAWNSTLGIRRLEFDAWNSTLGIEVAK
jgi:hypothetical protein